LCNLSNLGSLTAQYEYLIITNIVDVSAKTGEREGERENQYRLIIDDHTTVNNTSDIEIGENTNKLVVEHGLF
jgi:hypothetical protein